MTTCNQGGNGCKCEQCRGNYGKPHVPVEGKLNEQPMWTCLYCGVRLGGAVR